MDKQNAESACHDRYSPAATTVEPALCCPVDYDAKWLKAIPQEVIDCDYGCGDPSKYVREGETVLDLGSGAGKICFIASQVVGKEGKVIGVDMTKDMIKRSDALGKERGYTNVEFRLGEIEALPVEDDSVDVVISNCVINLCPDKKKAFSEIYRVLKKNGRLMISDIVTNSELPQEVRKSFDAWAGCIAGALEKDVYLNLIRDVGFSEIKIVKEIPYTVDVSEDLKGKILSISVKAHKLEV